MKKTIRRLLISFMSVFILCILCGAEDVSASAIAANTQLYVTGYTVTNETITPGDDFILTVTIQNFSTNTTAKDILFTVSNPEGVIPEYGTVSQTFIDEIGPGQSVDVSYAYNSDSSIQDSMLNFTAEISSDIVHSSTQIRIPVGRAVDFDTEDIFVPSSLTAGRVAYASAMVENISSTGVSNVVLVARSNGEDIATSNIGTISAGTVKTQSISVVFEEVGQYPLELVLTYENGEGEYKEYVIVSEIISVDAEQEIEVYDGNQSMADSETGQSEQQIGRTNARNIVLISSCGILLIAICCVILLLIYKRK